VSSFAISAELLDGEPSFCDPEKFSSLEVKSQKEGLVRERSFRVGSLNLIGMAVGHSDTEAIKKLALEHSEFREEEKYCTFYLNKGEQDKEEAFNHHYLMAPYLRIRHGKIMSQYSKVLRPVFEENPVTMVSCAKEHGYIALGCNGQKHRGPTAFAMLLAYVGCNPNNAVNIVNSIWGKNWVRFATRWKLANMAHQWGQENPKNRELLLSIMEDNR
tara:strand:- start:7154 stop:7801 length:648 start_codon:yes stop_codon:yes gene_type:complete